MSGIAGIGGIGGSVGTTGKLSVVLNVDAGGGVPGAGAGGGTGAVGTAGITPGAEIAGAGSATTGGAVGTVSAGAFIAFPPIFGLACGVDTGTGTPLSEALPVAFCALALLTLITAIMISNINTIFFMILFFI